MSQLSEGLRHSARLILSAGLLSAGIADCELTGCEARPAVMTENHRLQFEFPYRQAVLFYSTGLSVRVH